MTGANGTNGVTGINRRIDPGIFAPIPTFFLPESEDLDLPTLQTHVVRLAHAGVRPLLLGSMGEAHHVSHAERTQVIRAARIALDDAGLSSVPIIAGTGAGSTRETLQLSHEAASAGADAVIVITSGYFAGALKDNKVALRAFFRDVADASPIPVLVYNYPGASGGIDLDADVISQLATECANLCGVKLTCGNVGKLTRICGTVSEPSFGVHHPRREPAVTTPDAPFLVLGGFADFLVPSAFARGHGAITGLANVAPHALVRLYNLSASAVSASQGLTTVDPAVLAEAQSLQALVARADYTIALAGIGGTKALLEKVVGYGGAPRRPLPTYSAKDLAVLCEKEEVAGLIALEAELGSRAK